MKQKIDIKLFPIHPDSYQNSNLCPKCLPLKLLREHERQASKNTGNQSLDTLDSRGGLGVEELYYILQDKGFAFTKCVTYNVALTFLFRQIAKHLENLD